MITESQALFPVADPIPMPAPYWLLKGLLWVTFALHLLAMNALVGGGLLAAVMRLRRKEAAAFDPVLKEMSGKLPSLMAAAITLGVAPLLFAQVLYGQALYTSSVLMAWPWLLSLAFLVLAYYGLYGHASAAKGSGVAGIKLLGMSLAFLLCVGFLFSNNMTLMLVPDRWASIYFADPSGWNLNLGEGMLLPRYLHFMIAAAAVGGLVLALWGGLRLKDRPGPAKIMVRVGGRAFVWCTLAQFAGGIWFLLSLPSEKMRLYLGGDWIATSVLALAAVAALFAIHLVSRALKAEDPRPRLKAGAVTMAAVLLLMVIVRDLLRDAYLAPWLSPSDLPSKIQWSPFIVFLLLFLCGVAFWVIMMQKCLAEARGEGEGA